MLDQENWIATKSLCGIPWWPEVFVNSARCCSGLYPRLGGWFVTELLQKAPFANGLNL